MVARGIVLWSIRVVLVEDDTEVELVDTEVLEVEVVMDTVVEVLELVVVEEVLVLVL